MNTDGNQQFIFLTLPNKMESARILLVIILVIGTIFGTQPVGTLGEKSSASENGYRIDQPGTITFTVGVKISGKVEKPQVMIFLPKEKTLYREEKLTRSFAEELADPLPFIPIIE